MTELLTVDDALAVVDEMGLRLADPGLLASAVARSATTVFGRDAYPDLVSKVAALLDSVVRNHALVDGDKRLGWTLAVITLWLNDVELRYDEDKAFDMVMSVAEGRGSLDEVRRWFVDRLPSR